MSVAYYLTDCIGKKYWLTLNGCQMCWTNSHETFTDVTTAFDCVAGAFFGDVQDRKWPDCLACRWPVLIHYHLQTSCATSTTVACATPMGSFESERCVQAEENEGQSPRQSEGQAKGWAMYVPLCTVALTDVYKLPSDGGSGSSHINHSHHGVPYFHSSSAALTACFFFFFFLSHWRQIR